MLDRILGGASILLFALCALLWWRLDVAKTDLATTKASLQTALDDNKSQTQTINDISGKYKELVDERAAERDQSAKVLTETIQQRDAMALQNEALRRKDDERIKADPTCAGMATHRMCAAADRSLRDAAARYQDGHQVHPDPGQAARPSGAVAAYAGPPAA